MLLANVVVGLDSASTLCACKSRSHHQINKGIRVMDRQILKVRGARKRDARVQVPEEEPPLYAFGLNQKKSLETFSI